MLLVIQPFKKLGPNFASVSVDGMRFILLEKLSPCLLRLKHEFYMKYNLIYNEQITNLYSCGVLLSL